MSWLTIGSAARRVVASVRKAATAAEWASIRALAVVAVVAAAKVGLLLGLAVGASVGAVCVAQADRLASLCSTLLGLPPLP